MSIIEAYRLTRKFNGRTAVEELSLGVAEGEVLGFLGPNGAGKTTTIRMLTGLSKPTAGSARVFGYNIASEIVKAKKAFGVVPELSNMYDELTGLENLVFMGQLYGVPSRERLARAEELLKTFGLYERKDSKFATYSRGMKRALTIAAALVHRPRLLFLDEPTLGLDPQTREHMWKYISELAKRENMTILLTTHYMEEAELLCDRVGIIDAGKIIALDGPDALKAQLGGDKIIIKTRNPKLAALKRIDCIKTIHRKGDVLQIVVRSGGCNLKRILEKAGDVKNVELKPTTLNDVFLHHTGRQIREDEAEGGFWQRVMKERSK